MLGNPNRNGGNGCPKQVSRTNLFSAVRQCVTFREHRQLTCCQHHFQPTVAKSSKRNGSCNEGMGMMQPYCRAGGACYPSQAPQASGREWRLRFHKGHGFLRQTCRTNLLQCVTCCEHGQLKGWQPHFQPTVAESSISTMVHYGSFVCKSHMSQLRAQSISCNPNLGYYNHFCA